MMYLRFDYFWHAPSPRCPEDDDLNRIQEEDEDLVRLLEDLVPGFDAHYDTYEGDLHSFIYGVLVPEMKTTLDRLKREDEATHAAGRREIGVIMVDERETDSIGEDESDSLDKCEDDAVDEYESGTLEDDESRGEVR